MNKSILLQSIKSVSGFLAVFFIGIFGSLWSLENYPMIAGPVLIVLILSFMIRYEYNNRMEKHDREVMKRLKDGIK